MAKKRWQEIEISPNFALEIKTRDDLTDIQKEIIETALDKSVKCVMISGYAGTGKSFTTILSALMLLNANLVKEIIYLRSAIQAKDGQIGYIPGTVEEKMHFYNEPLNQILGELLSNHDINKLHKEEVIKCYPTSMLRSYNFHNAAVIAEESQLMQFDTLYTISTRLTTYSKLFVIGDAIRQNDLGKTSGFKQFIDIFSDQESFDNGFRYFELDSSQIVRSSFVKFVVQKVEQYQQKNGKAIIS